jgi:hypothetical protein
MHVSKHQTQHRGLQNIGHCASAVELRNAGRYPVPIQLYENERMKSIMCN